MSSQFSESSFYLKTEVVIPILFNFLINALYWSRKGEDPEAKILIDMPTSNLITVQDSGPGLRHLEKPFELGHSMRGSKGVGLWASKVVATSEGYDVFAKDGLRQGLGGACFCLSLS